MAIEQKEIMVSIHCLAYNHENYIAEALEGFLKQKTDFRFEILVHDDASTDKTAEIIRKYEEKYPEVVKPVYQSINQYSQGVPIFEKYQLPRVKGKYIAVCEGDDYWIDPYKLQKQIEYMENNPGCTLTFHNAVIVDTKSKILKKSFLPSTAFYAPYFRDVSSVYTADEMIKLDFAPTNSLMFRTRDASEYCRFHSMKPRVCGDLVMRLLYSSFGYAYYFSDKMSAYRTGVPGSASQMAGASAEAMMKTICGHLEILDDFDKYTNGKYRKSIDEVKRLKIFEHYYNYGALKLCSRKEFSCFRKGTSVVDRAIFALFDIKRKIQGIY